MSSRDIVVEQRLSVLEANFLSLKERHDRLSQSLQNFVIALLAGAFGAVILNLLKLG